MRGGALTRRLVENPRLYDSVQRALGYSATARRLERALADEAGGTLLDVGAGTGSWTPLARPRYDYVALDVDPLKLERLAAKYPGVKTTLGDACALPFDDGSFDDILCVAVSHHFDDAQLRRALAEMARVARRRIVFLDALRARSLTSKALWTIDRGAHPRPLGVLRSVFAEVFDVETEEVYSHRHTYVLWTGIPRHRRRSAVSHRNGQE